MPDRRYDEKEVGAILRRAAEIQSGLTPEVGVEGMTMTDLQKVAGEVGIEPGVIERAAREVVAGNGDSEDKINPNSFLLERTVDGLISEEAWDDIVTRLRRHVGRPGQSTVQGSTHEWIGGWDTGTLTLSATTRNGKTRFKLMGDTTGGSVLAWTIGPTFGFVLTLMTGALAAKAQQPGGIVLGLILTVILAVAMTTYFGLKRWRAKSRRGMERVFADVTSMAVPASEVQSLPEVHTEVDDVRQTLSNT